MIAQGIQKGIDLYKKQQKEKARAFNKRFKKAPPQKEGSAETDEPDAEEMIIYRQHWFPWTLLILSWLGMAVYFFLKVRAAN